MCAHPARIGLLGVVGRSGGRLLAVQLTRGRQLRSGARDRGRIQLRRRGPAGHQAARGQLGREFAADDHTDAQADGDIQPCAQTHLESTAVVDAAISSRSYSDAELQQHRGSTAQRSEQPRSTGQFVIRTYVECGLGEYLEFGRGHR